MSYADHADIENTVAGRSYAFGNSTVPTDDQVDAQCEQITEELNGALKQAGYVTPVTDADALKLLKLYCCYGVVPFVEYARFPDELETGEKDIAGFYRGLYEQALANIKDKAFNAPVTTSEGSSNNYWSANSADTDAATPWFSREDKF